MYDGPEQEERDRVLREVDPFPGYPIPWMEPDFQSWMYTYDGMEEADTAWQKYQRAQSQ